MERSPLSFQPLDDQEFNLREWHLRARISRENTSSRRYSASYIRSFREDSRSFRSNFTISSTASSPGCHLKDEIDPSTYSFTSALKALQARSGYVWEYLSPEGFALNSKWDEAERYISNPLSGEVPMECLSAKTLSGRSFRSYMAGRVTMSAPLVYSRRFNNPTNYKPASIAFTKEQAVKAQIPVQEEEMGKRTRDVGTQSTLKEESSSSPSPTSTPSIQERSIKRCEAEDGDEDGDRNRDAPNSNSSIKFLLRLEEERGKLEDNMLVSNTELKSMEEKCMKQVVEVKVTRDEEETKRTKEAGKKKKKKTRQLCNCRQSSGCLLLLSWRSLWMKKRHREKHKPPLPKPNK